MAGGVGERRIVRGCRARKRDRIDRKEGRVASCLPKRKAESTPCFHSRVGGNPYEKELTVRDGAPSPRGTPDDPFDAHARVRPRQVERERCRQRARESRRFNCVRGDAFLESAPFAAPAPKRRRWKSQSAHRRNRGVTHRPGFRVRESFPPIEAVLARRSASPSAGVSPINVIRVRLCFG